MSYFIKAYANYALTDEKEEYGIKIEPNHITLPIKLDRKEGAQLVKDIETMSRSQDGIEYIIRTTQDGYSTIDADTLMIRKQQEGTRSCDIYIQKTEEGIKIKNESPRNERYSKLVNDIIENTVLGIKLKEYWMENQEATIQKAEKRFEYILYGPEKEDGVKELYLEQEIEKEKEELPILKVKENKEIKKMFFEQDQELPAIIQKMKPKKRLGAMTKLEILMKKDFANYEKIDEEKMEELGQKVQYWENLGLDTSEIKEKTKKAIRGLEKKIKGMKKKFE